MGMQQYTIVNDADKVEMVLSLTDTQVNEVEDQLPNGWSIRPAYASETK
jgi:hypothetical protein